MQLYVCCQLTANKQRRNSKAQNATQFRETAKLALFARLVLFAFVITKINEFSVFVSLPIRATNKTKLELKLERKLC